MSAQPKQYDLVSYGQMIGDRVRMDAYARALRQAVRPGCVVVDLGTGTGIFAVLACRYGARRVYAIESSEIIDVAREIAAANACADRIQFLQGVSLDLTLQERADVVISDLRGVLPFFGKHIPAVADARGRFLKPGGTLIPRQDRLWAAVAETPELYGKLDEPWTKNLYGLDLGACRQMVMNSSLKGRVPPEQLLCEPACGPALDYDTVENPNLHCEWNWQARRAGTGHGLLVWFDTTLAEGVEFSNAPQHPELIYGSAFFPWSEPVPVLPGDRVGVTLQADLVGDDYIWRWETCVREAEPGQAKARFRQSTFFGAALSPAHLRKHSADYIPALDENGEIDEFILTRMDGRASQEEIARGVAQRFPVQFTRWEDALARVGELSQKYCR